MIKYVIVILLCASDSDDSTSCENNAQANYIVVNIGLVLFSVNLIVNLKYA